MANAMVALANLTLGSAQATVSFSSIPTGATYRDLRLVVSFSNTGTSNQSNFRVNGDTTSSYLQVGADGYGSSQTASWSATATQFSLMHNTGVLTTTEFAVQTLDFLDYAQTDKHKTVLARSSHTGEVGMLAGRWTSNTAISSITVISDNTFVAGSSFALYGIVS